MGITEFLLERAKEEGIKIGLQQTEAIAIHQYTLKIVPTLKKEGLAIDLIAKVTKLQIEEVEAL